MGVLECAMESERYKYVIGLFRERCKAAKEEQADLGEGIGIEWRFRRLLGKVVDLSISKADLSCY